MSQWGHTDSLHEPTHTMGLSLWGGSSGGGTCDDSDGPPAPKIVVARKCSYILRYIVLDEALASRAQSSSQSGVSDPGGSDCEAPIHRNSIFRAFRHEIKVSELSRQAIPFSSPIPAVEIKPRHSSCETVLVYHHIRSSYFCHGRSSGCYRVFVSSAAQD